jgi:hypothetical protein
MSRDRRESQCRVAKVGELQLESWMGKQGMTFVWKERSAARWHVTIKQDGVADLPLFTSLSSSLRSTQYILSDHCRVLASIKPCCSRVCSLLHLTGPVRASLRAACALIVCVSRQYQTLSLWSYSHSASVHKDEGTHVAQSLSHRLKEAHRNRIAVQSDTCIRL